MTFQLDSYGERFLPIEAIANLRENFEEGKKVRIAGRLMARRIMGKSTFGDLKDESARIQIYGKKGDLTEEEFEAMKGLSIGDIIGVEGELFKSKTGEMTVRITQFKRLTKIHRVMPEKWHGLKDIETRYRHRYVDLIVNNDVRETFKKRSRLIQSIRNFLDRRGFTEVETPMMHPIPGGARARPFVTHHNTLHADLFLRVAPELYLKRLLVGGLEKVYEINRNFRNEGISTRHNPEFTMLELYQAYADYTDMMEITEGLISELVKQTYGTTELSYQGRKIDFKTPWKRVSFYESIRKKAGLDLKQMDARAAAKKLKIEEDAARDEVDILNDIFEKVVEEDLWDPVFVIDYPTVMTPLAKAKKEDPSVCYRFELFIAGMEVANAFSELNDPVEQRKRLTEQQETIGETKIIDEDFLEALEYGMPPAGGLGIGVDRLVMLLTDQQSIRDVILFPQLRPQKAEVPAQEPRG